MATAYRTYILWLIMALLIVPQSVLADQEPVVQEIAKTLKEDKTAVIALKGKSPLRKKLTYRIVQPPLHGTVALKGSKVKYLPTANYFGPDTFQYVANDGEFDSLPGNVSLRIVAVNDTPIAVPQTLTIPMGVTSTFTLTALDAEGDPLIYKIVAKPKHGDIEISGNVVTYTPKTADFQGQDRFNFKVKDNKKVSKAVAVNLQIKEIGTVKVNADSLLVSDSQVAEIASIDTVDEDTVQLTTLANSALGTELTTNSNNVISILPGQNDKYPFGLAAKVLQTEQASDGSVIATLEPAKLSDVVEEARDQAISVPLDSENFVGVITPDAMQAITPTAAMPALNTLNSSLGSVAMQSQALAAEKGVNIGKEINLAMKIKLADMGVKNSVDAELSVSGSLKNMILTFNYDVSATDGLKTLDMKVSSDIQVDAKLSGDATIPLSFTNQVWKEVEKKQIELLGITGELSGLSGKNKIGKYPLAGFVYSVPCPETCPVLPGKTQTPVREAKMGGVIVWLYLTASGKIELKGDIGTRWNPSNLTLGLSKPESEGISVIKTLSKSNEGNLFDLLYTHGNATAEAKLGVSVEADFFALGVYLANAEAFVGAKAQATLEGELKYGWESLAGPARFGGQGCFTTQIGAGLIVSAAIDAGYKLESRFFKNVEGNFLYEFQWPSEDDMFDPGWHGAWYSRSDNIKECFPEETLPPQVGDIFDPPTNPLPEPVISPKVDITSSSITPTRLNVGDQLTVNATLTNNGNGKSKLGPLQYYLGNQAIRGACSIIPALNPAASISKSCQFSAPTIAGSYKYGICFGDTCTEPTTITVDAPVPTGAANVVISSSDVSPLSLNVGESITIGANLINNGNLVSDAGTLQYYIGDTLSRRYCHSVSALAPSASIAFSCQVAAPAVAGTYNYGVCYGSQCSEPKSITVSVPLIKSIIYVRETKLDTCINYSTIDSSCAVQVRRGDSFTKTWTFKNNGNVDLSSLEVVLVNQQGNLSPTVSSNVPSNVLAGSNFTYALNFTIPQNAPAGVYKGQYKVQDANDPAGLSQVFWYAFTVPEPQAFEGALYPSATELLTNDPLTLGIKINKGEAPYQVNIAWGDGNTNSLDNVGNNVIESVVKSYSATGLYTIEVQITDSIGQTITLTTPIKVTDTPPKATTWQGSGQDLDTNESNPDIPIAISANSPYSYKIDWTPQGSAVNYHTKYRLAVPSGLMSMGKKMRLTMASKGFFISDYDRALTLVTNTGKHYTSAILAGTPGFTRYLDINNGVENKTFTASLQDSGIGLAISDRLYALELNPDGKQRTYLYENALFTQLYANDIGLDTGENLSQIDITFKGVGQIDAAILDYDKDGSGTYEDNERFLLTTSSGTVIWDQTISNDLDFKDFGPLPTALLSPNGGETLVSGVSSNITWNPDLIQGATVSIYVLHDDPFTLKSCPTGDANELLGCKNWYLLQSSVSNTGSLAFDPADMKGSGSAYLVLIVSDYNPTQWDVSDTTFTLTSNNLVSFMPLNDTGITTCSDGTNNGLTCPVAGFPGQDGNRAAISPTTTTATAMPASALPNWIAMACWRRDKIDQPYRLKFDQGVEPVFGGAGCG